jgi:hypothetical protein
MSPLQVSRFTRPDSHAVAIPDLQFTDSPGDPGEDWPGPREPIWLRCPSPERTGGPGRPE